MELSFSTIMKINSDYLGKYYKRVEFWTRDFPHAMPVSI